MTELPTPAAGGPHLLAVFSPVAAAAAAGAAVAVPLLVHLLFRKCYQIVQWAAVRFLLAAQKRHPSISGMRRTYYCGAYWGYGFHEDGFTSALECARAVTGEPLWS